MTDVSAVLVALIGSFGLLLVAMFPMLWSARRHAKGANDAVNNRPKTEPRLAEVVDQIAEDVHELRHEQSALAMLFAEHLTEHRSR